jgi:hypothetical protein
MPTNKELFDKGVVVRREVLGKEYVDNSLAKADDFMMSTNYAVMMKRIITREPVIPNRQILQELATMFGLAQAPSAQIGQMYEGGYVSG